MAVIMNLYQWKRKQTAVPIYTERMPRFLVRIVSSPITRRQFLKTWSIHLSILKKRIQPGLGLRYIDDDQQQQLFDDRYRGG